MQFWNLIDFLFFHHVDSSRAVDPETDHFTKFIFLYIAFAFRVHYYVCTPFKSAFELSSVCIMFALHSLFSAYASINAFRVCTDQLHL